MSHNQKVTKKELAAILNVSYPTALKEYKNLLFILSLERNYLVKSDLKVLKIIN